MGERYAQKSKDLLIGACYCPKVTDKIAIPVLEKELAGLFRLIDAYDLKQVVGENTRMGNILDPVLVNIPNRVGR